MNHTIEDSDRIVRKVYGVKIASIALLLIIFALIPLAVWTNISYAQLFQPGTGQALLFRQSPDKQVLPNAHLLQNVLIKHAVKITSPTKHQLVPIGKNFIITGTTSYQVFLNNATSHCQVSIIVNGIKPYHTATATGPDGAADYSKWEFLLSSNYTTIDQGRLTPKRQF